MNKTAIVCSDVQLPKYESALKNAGFTFTVKKFAADSVNLIDIEYANQQQLHTIQEICRRVSFGGIIVLDPGGKKWKP